MQKRRPDRGGADLQDGDQCNPKRIRTRIQATEPMRLRLRALLWGEDWRGGARP
jgi:hypothetical protein